jgi:hypothetical protein
MNNALKFGILNTFFGIVIGTIVFLLAIGNGYEIIVYALPIANFITAYFLWKIIIRENNITIFKVIIVGILSGIINHYLCWIIVSCISYIGFLINGSFKDSLGGPPASPLQMITGGLAFSFFSFLFFGWLTVFFSLTSALITKFTNKKTTSNS